MDNWRERFDETFPDNYKYGEAGIMFETDLKKYKKEVVIFIENLLTSQKTSLCEKIEGMKKEKHHDYCTLQQIPLMLASCCCWKDYNWALLDVLEIIQHDNKCHNNI